MPPGVWHTVYTPTPSFCSGGHLYTYETLHLTEQSRCFDYTHAEFSTNANHNVERVLARMVLALPYVAQSRSESVRIEDWNFNHPFLIPPWCIFFIEIYRKPFLALARMVLKPEAYRVPRERKKAQELPLTSWDVLFREEEGEFAEAQKIIRAILERAKISEATIDSEVLIGGENWMAVDKNADLSASFF
jgi:hypothetical protein